LRINLNENSITKLTIIAPILTLIIFTTIVVSYFIEQTNIRFEQEIKKIEKEYTEHQKELVKREVLRTINYVKYRIKNVCDKDLEVIKNETIDFIQTIRYGQKGYIFIVDFDGNVVYNPFMRKNINVVKSTDKDGKPFVHELIDTGKQKDGGFVEYYSRSIETGIRENKISYVNSVKEWKWIVGGGVYIDEIYHIIEEKREEMKNKQKEDIQKILIASFVILVIVSLFSIVMTRSINSIFNRYKTSVESKKKKLESFNNELENLVNQKTKELKNLNKELEQRVDEEVRKNREKDEMLLMQSRLASMGEMISNIAHQWRQPLNKISLLINNIRVDKALGSANNEEKYYKTIELTLKYMSNTIDDFRNFFINQDEIITFDVKDAIKKAVSIVDIAIADKHIKLELSLDDGCTSNGNHSEFSQVIINIINNAKDILVSKKIKNPTISVKLVCNSDSSTITIEDNGGGISEEIIHKIFDPYFTTKHKNQGTGIGLYMSKTIIEKKMSGNLVVENVPNGAKFVITLPSSDEK
jgi:signal transduction histidine kinase